MSSDTKTIKIEIPEERYEEFWELKHDLHPEDGGTVDHDEAFEAMLDRYNGDRRERPDVLSGANTRIRIPGRHTHGYAYVNINVDLNGDPFEVFITVGDSGGEINSWADGLAKTISNALRAGVDPEVIADDLMGIRGPHQPPEDNGDYVFSVPDAVGIAMKRFVEGKLDPPEPVRGTPNGEMGVHD